ncbi:hypothetical protein [Streptomyces sasae]|uniref:hypothetical protein n=1 Tax=Streptomyces sasae TaxID=1266772 RepID=UPI00292F3F1D|nr:hypothetical protein [Streptomyces sasae]
MELCAKGKCVKDRLPDEDITIVNLPPPNDVGPDIGTVRLRITRPGACNGALAFIKEEGLTAKVPKSVSVAWHKQAMERATAEPTSSASS